MTEAEAVSISKFLSLVLRHQPGLIGIELDEAGWTDTDLLLQKLQTAGKPLSRDSLQFIVATNSKKRFAFDEGGRRIRASQGHSVPVNTGDAAQVPPPVLYHGTATRFLETILLEGLRKMSRLQVHLSADVSTAVTVGRRHGKAIVLQVDAAAMQSGGHLFYCSANGVWLTGEVPPQYLSVVSATKSE